MRLFSQSCALLCMTWLMVVTAVASGAEPVRIGEVFTDGAVLQRRAPIRIWGTANPQQKLTVTFADQSIETQTDQAGRWEVSLGAIEANAIGRDLTVDGGAGNSVVVKDVLVGEVWLAGGQSNMAGSMSQYSKTTQPDIDAANDPLLRVINVPRVQYAGQRAKGDFHWRPASPQYVPNFSAAAYYFAVNLREKLNVPIGIVSCNYGATPAESWMSRATLASKPDLKRILDSYDNHVESEFKEESTYLAKIEAYQQDLARFNAWRKDKKSSSRVAKPPMVMGPRNQRRPCGLYETMLARTIPYSISGVIWYQGEANANASSGFHYRSVFSELIKHWRQEFRNPDLPFLFVQLASLGRGKEPHWAELRDAQRWVNDNVPNTGMVVTLDAGDPNDIHPHTKDIVGRRLSLLARNVAYGEDDLVCQGPRLNFVESQGNKLVLNMERVGSGLVLKEGGEHTFEVAGTDGEFVPASAKLVDGRIVVFSAKIAAPQHVRYGWHTWVVPTLFNQEGLPASGFRSDDYVPVSKSNFYLQELSASKEKTPNTKRKKQAVK